MTTRPPFIGTLLTRFVVLLIGLIMLLPSLNMLYTYCNYSLWGTATLGVIDHPAASRGLGGKPLVQYTDATGTVHEFKTRAKTHWLYTPKKGEKVRILIHGNDPQKAIVDNLFYYVILPLIFLLAGGYCCLHALIGRTTALSVNSPHPGPGRRPSGQSGAEL